MSEDDLSKDKLIKQPKSKATRGGKGTSTRGRGKGRGSKSWMFGILTYVYISSLEFFALYT